MSEVLSETPIALALSGLSFIMTVIWGGPLVRVLRHYRIGKIIRVEGPQSHITKMGTPTMGGIMIILPVTAITLLLNAVTLLGFTVLGRSVLVPLGVMAGYALLGAVDDWEGIRGPRRGLGMRARTKFFFQVILAIGAAFALKYVLISPELFWFAGEGSISLGIMYIPIAVFIIVGMSNAVNFTDGLDGLAGLISATAFAAYGAIALMQEQIFLARFCFTVVGALFGFLCSTFTGADDHGRHGALALGATLGVVALATGRWLLLPVIAIIPVAEALSVVLQVGYFRLTKGKRLFKMAPFHHHFELLGWSETQVVQRFWLVGLLAAMFGIALTLI
jgi:phospho-N-acetylmuramoyl-pentapeptide-transferase